MIHMNVDKATDSLHNYPKKMGPEAPLLHIVFNCLPQLVIITQDVHCATNEWQRGTPGAVSCRSQITLVDTEERRRRAPPFMIRAIPSPRQTTWSLNNTSEK